MGLSARFGVIDTRQEIARNLYVMTLFGVRICCLRVGNASVTMRPIDLNPFWPNVIVFKVIGCLRKQFLTMRYKAINAILNVI